MYNCTVGHCMVWLYIGWNWVGSRLNLRPRFIIKSGVLDVECTNINTETCWLVFGHGNVAQWQGIKWEDICRLSVWVTSSHEGCHPSQWGIGNAIVHWRKRMCW